MSTNPCGKHSLIPKPVPATIFIRLFAYVRSDKDSCVISMQGQWEIFTDRPILLSVDTGLGRGGGCQTVTREFLPTNKLSPSTISPHSRERPLPQPRPPWFSRLVPSLLYIAGLIESYVAVTSSHLWNGSHRSWRELAEEVADLVWWYSS